MFYSLHNQIFDYLKIWRDAQVCEFFDILNKYNFLSVAEEFLVPRMNL